MVTRHVEPFYKSAALPTATLKTLKKRAKDLYEHHKQLTKLRDATQPPQDFQQRCSDFSKTLDGIFPAAPTTNVLPDAQEKFQALEVDVVV